MFDPWNVIPLLFAPKNVAQLDVQLEVTASKYLPGNSVTDEVQFSVFHPAEAASAVPARDPVCARNIPLLS